MNDRSPDGSRAPVPPGRFEDGATASPSWLRSAGFVRGAHAALFAVFTGVLLVLFYQVIFDRIGVFTWIAVAVFVVEGVILLTNDGRCPITVYTEALGSEHAQVSDIFFPKWIADRVFPIYSGAFALALLLLLVRLIP